MEQKKKKRNNEEAKLQKTFVKWLESQSLLHLKVHGGQMYLKIDAERFSPYILKEGFSDIIVFNNNETYFIELKSSIGKLRETQYQTFVKLANNGFKQLYVLRPHQLELLINTYQTTRDFGWSLANTIPIGAWRDEKWTKNRPKPKKLRKKKKNETKN